MTIVEWGRKITLGFIWLSFLSYTLWLAPLDQADTWETGRNLITRLCATVAHPRVCASN
jgi:hypothetical protein